jgi:hypothetical protein
MFLELEIPANTQERAPAKKSYDIGRALIKGIKVHIPPGHKYLTHLEILSQGRPVYKKGERYLTGDGTQLQLEQTMLEGPPFEITLSGWSEDDTYPHTFYIEVI